MSLWVVQGGYNIHRVGRVDAFSSVAKAGGLCILRTAFRVWSASIAYNLEDLQSVWYVYRDSVSPDC